MATITASISGAGGARRRLGTAKEAKPASSASDAVEPM